METFQIYERAQKTAYQHIEAQPLEIEHNGRKNKACRKHEAIQNIRRYYKYFVLYGIDRLVYAAQNRAGDEKNVVDNAAYDTAQKAYHKNEKLHKLFK